jgi:hypothetical protein
MAKKTGRPKSSTKARATKPRVTKARATKPRVTKARTTTKARATKARATKRPRTGKKAPARSLPAKKRAAPASKRAPAKPRPKLPTMTHPIFGRVTADPVEGLYWQKTLRVADRDVSVDLTIEDPAAVSMELLDSAAQVVSRLAHFDALARAGLRDSHEQEGSEVTLYVTHHLQELSAATLLRIFAKPKESIGPEDVLSRLLLERVGAYPAKSGGSATFDYSIGRDETQYVLAVQLDESGGVVGISMQS